MGRNLQLCSQRTNCTILPLLEKINNFRTSSYAAFNSEKHFLLYAIPIIELYNKIKICKAILGGYKFLFGLQISKKCS